MFDYETMGMNKLEVLAIDPSNALRIGTWSTDLDQERRCLIDANERRDCDDHNFECSCGSVSSPSKRANGSLSTKSFPMNFS